MSVYVDNYSKCWCHMFADTLAELHAMAGKIGLKRAWFQPKSRPHYDLVSSKKALAIKNGAIEIIIQKERQRFLDLMKSIEQ